MAIQKLYASVEFNDGNTVEDVRVTVQDQLQWSTSARANRWDPQEELRAQAFMCWHALKRNGHTSMTWEEFAGGGALSAVIEDKTEDAGQAADPADPTAAAAGTA